MSGGHPQTSPGSAAGAPRTRPRRESASRALRVLTLAAGLLLLPGVVSRAPGQGAWAPDELLVRFKPAISSAQAEALYRELGATRLDEIPQMNVHRIRVPAEALASVAETLARRPEVEFVERNRLHSPNPPPRPP